MSVKKTLVSECLVHIINITFKVNVKITISRENQQQAKTITIWIFKCAKWVCWPDSFWMGHLNSTIERPHFYTSVLQKYVYLWNWL